VGKEPLNLPRGSVRAILALILCLSPFVVLVLPVDFKEQALSGAFALAGIAARDYFEHRKRQNHEDGPVLPDPVVNE